MELSEKLRQLRKQQHLSQEALAEKLAVTRQAVSRWEMGTAQPDGANLRQLSKVFGVEMEYLLDTDQERPAAGSTAPGRSRAHPARTHRTRRLWGLCIGFLGLLGQGTFYILSRFIEVPVPRVTTSNGMTHYTWQGDWTGHSYHYFIQTYDLEGLQGALWFLVIAGFLLALLSGERIKTWMGKWKNLRRTAKK